MLFMTPFCSSCSSRSIFLARRSGECAHKQEQSRQNRHHNHHRHHSPVMLREIVDAFEPVSRLKTFVDGTVGAGGHAREILERRGGEIETFLGIDVDASAIALAKKRIETVFVRGFDEQTQQQSKSRQKSRVVFARGNFAQMKRWTEIKGGFTKADGILLDLGVSSMQLDRAERGFSFREDGPLDMRMALSSDEGHVNGHNDDDNDNDDDDDDANNATKASPMKTTSADVDGNVNQLTAFDVVNGWSEEDIGRIFRDYGGEKHWKLLAKRVCDAREKNGCIETTLELAKVLGNTPGRREKIHPATRAFQAIRIATNDELGAIERVLPQAIDMLNPGGRLAIITFHSLEDVRVKCAFRKFAGIPKSEDLPIGTNARTFLEMSSASSNLPNIVNLITRKPIRPSAEEIEANPRSRSAKLRICEKI